MVSTFISNPIVIAVRDDLWGGVFGDAFDNDPIYYEHHEGNYETDEEDEDPSDGFVPRGNHYVVLSLTKHGEVSIDMGYHLGDIPARAFIMVA